MMIGAFAKAADATKSFQQQSLMQLEKGKQDEGTAQFRAEPVETVAVRRTVQAEWSEISHRLDLLI